MTRTSIVYIPSGHNHNLQNNILYRTECRTCLDTEPLFATIKLKYLLVIIPPLSGPFYDHDDDVVSCIQRLGAE